jgi:hypothetical protein
MVTLTEGFDSYSGIAGGSGTMDDNGWIFPSSTADQTLSAGRFGGLCYGNDTTAGSYGSAQNAYRVFPVGVGLAGSFGFAYNGGQVSRRVLALGQAGGLSLVFWHGSSNDMNVYRDDVVNWLCNSGPSSITTNNWYYIEVEFLIADVGGYVRLYIDGTLKGSFSGDTMGASVSTMNSIRFWRYSDAYDVLVDDIYLSDKTTCLGPQRIETIRPNADAAVQWTPSTGTLNYACVDEATVSNTDYVSGGSVGLQDLYDFGNLSSTPAQVNAVNLQLVGYKTDAAARAIAAAVKSGGTTNVGSDNFLTSNNIFFNRFMEVNPVTGLPWTAADVNAIQAGPKVTA